MLRLKSQFESAKLEFKEITQLLISQRVEFRCFARAKRKLDDAREAFHAALSTSHV